MKKGYVIHNNLKDFISEGNISSFARKIGVSRNYLSDIRNEKRRPGSEIMFLIARELGKPIEQIFFMTSVK